MEHLLGGRLRGVERGQPVELRAVLAPQAHDLARREQLPPVVRGVVAERRQPAVRAWVAARRRVEVELHVRRVLAPVRAKHVAEVADAHVVGDEPQILAAEVLGRDRQVARRAGQRLLGVEALVDPCAGAPQCLRPPRAAAPLGTLEAPRVALAGGRVDAHAEQVGARLGQDLRQSGGGLRAAGSACVGPAGALQEDERLERVGVDAREVGGALHERSPLRRPLGARGRAAGRQRVQEVAVPGRGPAHELVRGARDPRRRDRAAARSPRPPRRAAWGRRGRRRGASRRA